MNYAQSKQETLQMIEELLKRREAILQEKERLNKENGEIERQLIGLEQVLEGLEFLGSDIPAEIAAPGFTEEIRKILQETTVALTATEIRDLLVAEGRPSTKNLLISVHTVLGRLESDLSKSQKDGKSAYIWKHIRRRRHVFPSRHSEKFWTGLPPISPPKAKSVALAEHTITDQQYPRATIDGIDTLRRQDKTGSK